MANEYISIFPHISAVDQPKHIPFDEFIGSVKHPSKRTRECVDAVRSAKTKAECNKYKMKLQCITPSGTFSRRDNKSLLHLSGLLCIDLDNVKNIKAERQRISLYPYVVAVILSPSGNGLKVFVNHDLKNPSSFSTLYLMIGHDIEVEGRTDLVFDTKCSDLSHACFCTYDDAAYINKNATVYHFDASKATRANNATKKSMTYQPSQTTNTISTSPVITLQDPKTITEAIVQEHKWFEDYYSMFPGTRNSNLFILACYLKEAGIPEDLATNYLIVSYSDPDNGFNATEIETTTHSAYAH